MAALKADVSSASKRIIKVFHLPSIYTLERWVDIVLVSGRNALSMIFDCF